MKDYQFGKNQLDIILRTALNNSNFNHNIEQIQNDLKINLQESLRLKEWSLEHFLSLDVGFHCIEELKFTEYDPNPNHNGTYSARTKNKEEVKETLKEAEHFFVNRMETLKLFIENKEVSNSDLPIKWLELTRKIPTGKNKFERIIVTTMDKLIRYAHYNIDPKLAEEGIFPISRYSLTEAARELNLSEDELITKCFNQDFGVYITERGFNIQTTSTHQITQTIINEQADFSYIYPFEGLVRLQKTSEYFPSHTVKEIYCGGNIEVKFGNDCGFVPLQLSLAEYVQGKNKLLILRGKAKISRNDLFFIKDEIQAYKRKRSALFTDVTHGEVNQPTKNKERDKPKQKRVHALNELIEEVYVASEDKSAAGVWNKLKELADAHHEVVQEVSSWTSRSACISWITHRGKETKTGLRTFENYISKLNNTNL